MAMKNHNSIAETKFCPYCGQEFVSANSFCPYCGEDLPKQQEQESQELKFVNFNLHEKLQINEEWMNIWSEACHFLTEKSVYSSFSTDTTSSERYSLIERQRNLLLKFTARNPQDGWYKKVLKYCDELLALPNIKNDLEPLPLEYQYFIIPLLDFLIYCFFEINENKELEDKYSEDLKILASDIFAFQMLCINREQIIDYSDDKETTRFLLDFNPYQELEEYAPDIKVEIESLENEMEPHVPNFKRHIFNPKTKYWNELDGLIGLKMVKDQIRAEIENYKFQLKRKEANPNLKVSFSFHCIFKGKPGTGKTTVARLVAGILKEEGMIDKGCCVEVNASELISGWVGFSAKNAKLAVLKAMDGVLFIDEAYALMNSQGSKGNPGDEVIDTLTPYMENYRGRIVVILAGYNEEMDIFLAQANTGFPSRFQSVIQFEDYNGPEMLEIFKSLVKKNGFELEKKSINKAALIFNFIDKYKDDIPGFANARTVRNVFEKIEKRAAQRMIRNNISGKDMNILTVEDVTLSKQELANLLGISLDNTSSGSSQQSNIPKKEEKQKQETNTNDTPSDVSDKIKNLEEQLGSITPYFERHVYEPSLNYWNELNRLIGLSTVKEQLRRQINNYKIQIKQKEIHPDLNVSLSFHCIFKGNPGTGKTTVARLVAGILKEEGMIDNGCCVEVKASELISGYVGVTPKYAELAFLRAMGGVLFIDEAYALMNSNSSKRDTSAEVIDTLTPLMENYRGRIVVILAGYNKEMDIFISQANTGFPSRFKAVIQFEDYNGEEMMQIFYAMVTRKFKAGMDVLNRAALLFKHIDKIKDGVPGFANARTVRTIYEMIEERAHQRMAENNLSGEDLFILTVDDVSLSKREVNIALGVI